MDALRLAILQLHNHYHRIRKLAAFDFRRAFHQAGEIVSDVLAGDGGIHRIDNGVGGFGPAHVAQHHFGREDLGAGVDVVLAGVLRCGSVGGFETGH